MRTLKLLLLMMWLPALSYAQSAVVDMAFMGDIMLSDGPGRAMSQGKDPFRAIAPLLHGADVRLGNIECVIAHGGSALDDKPWTFRAQPKTSLPLLKKYINVAALANNHSGDYGPEAFAEMLTLLHKTGIPYVGGGLTQEQAHEPLILVQQGIKIAILNYNEFFPRRFEADLNQPGIAWSDDEFVQYDFARTKARYQPDLIIAYMHWGWENEAHSSQRQHQLAQLMIDAGAAAVIGGHPHRTQDIAIYRGKPIIYSLGNFIFDGFSSTANNTGWLARMQFDRQGARAFQIHEVAINRQGLPRPSGKPWCWQHGDNEAHRCAD
jgi:poly-gamma-glutamate synthesis protein (capsule biosynthesis protein)